MNTSGNPRHVKFTTDTNRGQRAFTLDFVAMTQTSETGMVRKIQRWVSGANSDGKLYGFPSLGSWCSSS